MLEQRQPCAASRARPGLHSPQGSEALSLTSAPPKTKAVSVCLCLCVHALIYALSPQGDSCGRHHSPLTHRAVQAHGFGPCCSLHKPHPPSPAVPVRPTPAQLSRLSPPAISLKTPSPSPVYVANRSCLHPLGPQASTVPPSSLLAYALLPPSLAFELSEVKDTASHTAASPAPRTVPDTWQGLSHCLLNASEVSKEYKSSG